MDATSGGGGGGNAGGSWRGGGGGGGGRDDADVQAWARSLDTYGDDQYVKVHNDTLVWVNREGVVSAWRKGPLIQKWQKSTNQPDVTPRLDALLSFQLRKEKRAKVARTVVDPHQIKEPADWIKVRDTFKIQDFRLPHRS